MKMANRYEFTMTFSGYGKTPKEGWEDAVDTIMGDSHFQVYDPSEMTTKITDTDIED